MRHVPCEGQRTEELKTENTVDERLVYERAAGEFDKLGRERKKRRNKRKKGK